jgi:F-type H+-transporting ATPase subunit gamma
MEVRDPRSAAVVIVTSDRGFCGAFNANLIRAALSHAAVLPGSGKGVGLMCIGRKGADYLGKRGYNVIRRFPGPAGDFTFGQAQAIAREIVEGYRKGDYDRVDVVYNEFKSIAQQRIVIEQFLPIPEEPESAGRPVPSDYIYEPGRREILLALLPRHLDFQIWRVLLESRAAEEAARMVAMESATENAREMIASLQLQYNKARQAAITKELLEVVAGAEALTGASRA